MEPGQRVHRVKVFHSVNTDVMIGCAAVDKILLTCSRYATKRTCYWRPSWIGSADNISVQADDGSSGKFFLEQVRGRCRLLKQNGQSPTASTLRVVRLLLYDFLYPLSMALVFSFVLKGEFCWFIRHSRTLLKPGTMRV